MAVFSEGMRGEEIKQLQERLRSEGLYQGKIDGIYGPMTKGAVLEYQTMHGLDRDGIAGPQTLGHMGLTHLGQGDSGGGSGGPAPYIPPPVWDGFGLPPWSGGAGGGMGDYTLQDPDTRFTQLAGHPEIWKNSSTDEWFVVYFVPDSKPKIPMLYRVQQQSDLKIFFGDKPVKADHTYSQGQIDGFGSIVFGTADSLPKSGHPFMNFAEDMERAKETMPWLEDPEVFAIYANANLLGRPVEQWELESTDWWQEHTEAEREWMWLSMRDPLSAQRLLEDNRTTLYETFRNLGVANPPEELVSWMANKFTTGAWSDKYLKDQAYEITGGTTSSGLDGELGRWMQNRGMGADLDATNYVTDVKDKYRQWLGPSFAPTDTQIQEWAAKHRQAPQAAADELTEYLRRQRMALFPEYEDDSLTYEDIAGPWRSFATNIWGQRPDETSEMFTTILKMNDAAEAGKLLRREGLRQGVGAVEQDALAGIFQAAGGQVRRPL